jgi:hypothetical protein
MALWISPGAGQESDKDAGLLVVTLRGTARVKSEIVCVQDVALVQGGSASLRDKVSRLDVAELRNAEAASVTRDQVYYRLLLAGIDKKAFRVAGPAHLTVQLVKAPGKEGGVISKQEKVDDPVLIKPRDVVRLVAQIGSVRVTALGEALQDGRAGQMIRVRNTNSNKIVTGRVLDRNHVAVEY